MKPSANTLSSAPHLGQGGKKTPAKQQPRKTAAGYLSKAKPKPYRPAKRLGKVSGDGTGITQMKPSMRPLS